MDTTVVMRPWKTDCGLLTLRQVQFGRQNLIDVMEHVNTWGFIDKTHAIVSDSRPIWSLDVTGELHLREILHLNDGRP